MHDPGIASRYDGAAVDTFKWYLQSGFHKFPEKQIKVALRTISEENSTKSNAILPKLIYFHNLCPTKMVTKPAICPPWRRKRFSALSIRHARVKSFISITV